MRISDWSSDVCSSDLPAERLQHRRLARPIGGRAIAARGVRLRKAEQSFVIAEHLALGRDLVEQFYFAREHAEARIRLRRIYRPQTFSELIGQDAMVTTLANAIKRSRQIGGAHV